MTPVKVKRRRRPLTRAGVRRNVLIAATAWTVLMITWGLVRGDGPIRIVIPVLVGLATWLIVGSLVVLAHKKSPATSRRAGIDETLDSHN